MKRCWKIAALLALAGSGGLTAMAEDKVEDKTATAARPAETPAQFAARTQWWREAKFGMFIHWGVYAVPADGEWHMNTHKMQVADYEKFPPQFNPTHFDAKAWVSMAKNAGMKYITVTTKHHDGFAMWDTKQTAYNVVKATPFHHDPLKDLAAECKRQGIRLCFYHSLMDWHHPDYLPRRDWEKDTRPAGNASLDRYVQDFMEPQLKELLTNYGPIGDIWFDGGWEHTAQEWRAQEVTDLIRRLQPGILINDRSNLPEDFATPEQTIPAGALPNGRLWETCMTMNDDWGYAKDDHNWKSASDLVHKLCDIAGKGGNFLLNVGPTADGVFPLEAVDRLQQIGRWMKANGAGIYGATKSPFRRLSFDGRCTQKGNTLFLHVFHWPNGGLRLDGLQTPIVSARALDGGEHLAVDTGGEWPVIAAPKQMDALATVIEVRLSAPPVDASDPAIALSGNAPVSLTAMDADIEGTGLRLEERGGAQNIGYWTNAKDAITWPVKAVKAGDYRVEVEAACQRDDAGSRFEVRLEGMADTVTGTVPGTGDWATFQIMPMEGTLHIPAGKWTLRVAPLSVPHGAVMNLRRVILTPQSMQ